MSRQDNSARTYKPAAFGVTKARAGLTLLEMLLSASLLAFVITSGSAWFITTSRAATDLSRSANIEGAVLSTLRLIHDDVQAAQSHGSPGRRSLPSPRSHPIVLEGDVLSIRGTDQTELIRYQVDGGRIQRRESAMRSSRLLVDAGPDARWSFSYDAQSRMLAVSVRVTTSSDPFDRMIRVP